MTPRSLQNIFKWRQSLYHTLKTHGNKLKISWQVPRLSSKWLLYFQMNMTTYFLGNHTIRESFGVVWIHISITLSSKFELLGLGWEWGFQLHYCAIYQHVINTQWYMNGDCSPYSKDQTQSHLDKLYSTSKRNQIIHVHKTGCVIICSLYPKL